MDTLAHENMDYNNSYISLGLIDELDYVIGGYGKPDFKFIFSLNTFVESFIGCSRFYFSSYEADHCRLTSKILFPKGRPILDLLIKEGNLSSMGGFPIHLNDFIYQRANRGRSFDEMFKCFETDFGAQVKDKSHILRSPADITKKLSFLRLEFSETHFVVMECDSDPIELVDSLLQKVKNSATQTTLPVYLFNHQVSQLKVKPPSIRSLEKLSQLHLQHLEELKKQIGFTYQPIPPFTNILLSQINSIEDIPDKLISLRNDFSNLRLSFEKFEKRLFESESIKQLIETKREMDEFWKVFNKKYIDKASRIVYGLIDIVKQSDYEKSLDNAIDQESTSEIIKDFNLGKIAGKATEKSYNWIKDKRIISRFKGLTNIWELFLEGKALDSQVKNIERIFKVEFHSENYNEFYDFIKKTVPNIGIANSGA